MNDDLEPIVFLEHPKVKLVNAETGEVLCEGTLSSFCIGFSRYDGFKSYADTGDFTIDLGGNPWILQDDHQANQS